MGLVDDVYDFLEAQGIAGGSTDWALFRRRVNDTRDRIVVLTEDGGIPPEIGRMDGIGDSAFKDPAVQTIVRAEAWNGDASEAKSQEIFDALHGRSCVMLGSTEYIRVAANTAGPIFAGFDENGRPTHTLSYRCKTGTVQLN